VIGTEAAALLAVWSRLVAVVREQVRKLSELGPFPSSAVASPEQALTYQQLIEQISRPLEDDEARALLDLFGPDDFFGAAWTVLHLIETAPNSPVTARPPASANEWIRRIWMREQPARRSKAK
jgi:hypothetical protein